MTRQAALILLIVNAAITIGLIALHAHWIGAAHRPAFAVLDVAELYRLKERAVAAVLMRPDANADEREDALRRAKTFGAELTTLIERLPAVCRCLILARGAVIGREETLPDLTPDVRRRLGL